jgi:hypothetical protein
VGPAVSGLLASRGDLVAKISKTLVARAWMPAQVEFEELEEFLFLRCRKSASGRRLLLGWLILGDCVPVLGHRALPVRFLCFLGLCLDLLLKILVSFLLASARFAFAGAATGRFLFTETGATRVPIAPTVVALLFRSGRKVWQNRCKNSRDG